MKDLLYRMLLVFVAATTLAFGGSGGSVRGGETAVWVDQKWQLKDILVYSRPDQPGMRLADPIRKAISDDVKPIVEAYSSVYDSAYWDAILGDEADYRWVKSLPKDCPPDGKLLGTGEANVGCTDLRGTTYLVSSVFEKMDNLTRVLVVLHERAHAFDPAKDAHERWIRKFIASVEVALRVSYEQDQGKFRVLVGWEVQALRRLVDDPDIREKLLIGGRGGSEASVKTVVARGGGIVRTTRPLRYWEIPIDGGSFLGIASLFEFLPEYCLYDAGNPKTWPSIKNGSTAVNSAIACSSLDRSHLKSTIVDRQRPSELLKEEGRQSKFVVRGLEKYSRFAPNRFLGTNANASLLMRDSALDRCDLRFQSTSSGLIERALLERIVVSRPVSSAAGGLTTGAVLIYSEVSVRIVDRVWNERPLWVGDIYVTKEKTAMSMPAERVN